MSQYFKILLCSFVALNGFGNYIGVHGQSSSPAKVITPIVRSSQGKETILSCATSPENTDNPSKGSSSRIRYCVWERLQQQGRNDHAFIINFNDINSQPGLYSGVTGYSYTGEGFSAGECGVKISFVKTEDIAKWQCTLITDNRVYRGYVDLVKMPDPPAQKKSQPNINSNPLSSPASSSKVAIASSRTAIDDDTPVSGGDTNSRARPIITSYNDARSIVQPEIIVHSTSSNGSPQLIQEVKVESAGLEIKPRRGGKLIVFE